MIRRGLAAAALLVLASCEPAFATTWTVNTDADLTAANAGAVAGDVVRINAGTYTVQAKPAHSGTAGSRIYYYGVQSNPTAVVVPNIYFGDENDGRNHDGGNYVTFKWISATGDIGAPSHLQTGLYFATTIGDSMVKCSTTGGSLDLLTRSSVFDSLTVVGTGTKHIDGSWEYSNADAPRPANNVVKNSTFTFTNNAPAQFQFLKLRRSQYNTFYNNVFNDNATNITDFCMAVEFYQSYYNLFQNNTWNYAANNYSGGTRGTWAFRDSSAYNRWLGNTLNVTGNAGMFLGWAQDGSDGNAHSGDQTPHNNYCGFNTMSFQNPNSGAWYFTHGMVSDTMEFNVVKVTGAPAISNQGQGEVLDGVMRHNTFYTDNSAVVDLSDTHTEDHYDYAGNLIDAHLNMASNVFYSTAAGANALVKLIATGVTRRTFVVDSLGVVFNPGGTAGASITRAGVGGAPGSGAAYGASGKSVWGSPRFQDSTSTTFDGHLRSGSYADNATGLTHVDGYAGAYAPGAATYFNIVSSAGSNGSISPNGTTAVAQGASQTYTMTPNANYAVDSVYVDNVYAGALTSYSFTNVQATHTIRVVFKAAVVNYTITASATNGALISPNGATVVASGGSQAYTITASTGYHVYDIQVDGSSVGTSSPYTFSNVLANHTIQATGAINTYTLTASAGANGSISPSGVTTVNYGASQAYTITPNSGYHVSSVTVDGSGVGTPTSYTFTNVTANHTIAVTFAADAVTYTVTASATGFGSVTPGGATVWGAGTSPVYTIVPLDGYQLDDVLVDGVSVGTPTLYTFTSIGANHTISATFSLALTSYIITPSTANGASINPSTATLVGSGLSKTFTIWAPDGTSPSVYVDGSYVGQVTSYTFSSVAANHTIFVTAVSTGGVSPTEGCECYRPQ